MTATPPLVATDGPLDDDVRRAVDGRVTWVPLDAAAAATVTASPNSGGHDGSYEDGQVLGIYTYGHPRIDDPVLERFPALRVVSNYGVGVDHIDLDAARRRGIPVGNTPGVLDAGTADMAFGLLLAVARRIVEGDRYARSPAFRHYDPGYMLGQDVQGATIGIVGLGRIGLHIAQRARAFDMRILYHNRNRRPDAEAQLGATWVSRDDLLQQADFVVLACPLTPQTRHWIDRDALRRMKPSAMLVNIARGGVVDTDALAEGLEQGWIAGAALDVTDPEPLPRDHPLLRRDDVVITPHLGTAATRTRRGMAELSVENLLLGLAGRPLRTRCDP